MALAEDDSSGPPVPPVERNDHMSIAMKQIGTRIDLAMKR